MKVIKPSHKLMLPNDNPYQHIERIGRICYRSEDSITKSSAEPFCARMFNSNHHAMIEHFRFIVEVNKYDYMHLNKTKFRKYLTMTDGGRYLVSASARGLHDMYEYIVNDKRVTMSERYAVDAITDIVCLIIKEYDCPMIFAEHFRDAYNRNGAKTCNHIIKDFGELSEEEYRMHAWYSIHFVCDRGVSHEMVRHRDASFAQESTRYCNYNNGKFGGEITVIEPFFWDENEERHDVNGCEWHTNKYGIWFNCMVNLEKAYMMLIESGATPQEARTVLPNSLKTEIVVTAQVYEWNHMFDLRVIGTTGAPHPQIREVMKPAYNEMVEKGYIKRRDTE